MVLVGHSYAGAVITEAAARVAGRVRHLIYLTAFVLEAGESTRSFELSNALPPDWKSAIAAARQHRDDGTIVLDPVAAVPALYGCCAPDVQRAAAARLSPQASISFTEPVTDAAWRRIPNTFVRCTADRAIALAHQDVMAGRCDTVHTLEADHSPFASMPAPTAEIVERVSKCGG